MHAKASQIVAAARECLGTPFHHQGRVPGAQGGLDCVGVLAHVLRRCGWTVHEPAEYARYGDGTRLRALLDAHGFVAHATPEPGDLLGFRSRLTDVDLQHVGILTEPTRLLHATWRRSCSEITYPDAFWQPRYVAAWRFPHG